jgi:hypothetical protein
MREFVFGIIPRCPYFLPSRPPDELTTTFIVNRNTVRAADVGGIGNAVEIEKDLSRMI